MSVNLISLSSVMVATPVSVPPGETTGLSTVHQLETTDLGHLSYSRRIRGLIKVIAFTAYVAFAVAYRSSSHGSKRFLFILHLRANSDLGMHAARRYMDCAPSFGGSATS
ncbi:hypothetical protein LIPSTDRAFT_241248 [Lipomyces starkeyi NRRL Y-11557]|uniref:Uncharacterized protein n=1 Tax=Lipomyces starkeyi NRRL Y-11557 TaxID=675824 RepID=A0A1E3QDY2_LIPST|nr:hypothetical protein LIPSTDRAFT_241248 [Lipomyces starkeyi NRRL Y-11557]